MEKGNKPEQAAGRHLLSVLEGETRFTLNLNSLHFRGNSIQASGSSSIITKNRLNFTFKREIEI